MFAVPGDTPVALPAAVMVATLAAADVQLTRSVTSRLTPSAKMPMALNCCVAPAATVGLGGAILTLAILDRSVKVTVGVSSPSSPT